MEIPDANLSCAKYNQEQDTTKVNNSPGKPSQSEGMVYPELFTGDSLLELCNSFWKPSQNARRNVQPYLRGCKWSPDGTCCLSVVNSDGMHIMELPRDLYEGCPTRERMITLLPAVVHLREGGLVYDFCWYPKMNSYIPETCSWLTTMKNSPIQMWDAYDGSLRCSYRGYNAVDEMEPALSVIFISEGSRIVGGYRNCLRTFDVDRPGRDFIEHKIKSPASCVTTKDRLLAVGSWNTNIQLFSISDMGTYKSVGNMHGHTGGITHMQFTPDGTKLVSGARKDHKLLVWDLRYYKKPLNILHRCVRTNQTIYFDISYCGRYLVSGGSDGVISVWDDNHIQWTTQFNVNNTKENVTFRFHVYQDSCNSVSIHPSRPILATGSGQFHFIDPVKVLEQESDNSGDDDIQHVTKTPQLDINNTLTEESLKSSSGSLSNDEKDKEFKDEIEVEISEKSNINIDLSNEDKKSNSQVEVSYQDTSRDSMEETVIGLCDELQVEKQSIEECQAPSSNEIVQIHKEEVYLESLCEKRPLETSPEMLNVPVKRIKESDNAISLNTGLITSLTDECNKNSFSRESNISNGNHLKDHSEVMDVDKEFNSNVECEKSNGRLKEKILKEEKIDNKDALLEKKEDMLHKSPELCNLKNVSKSTTKSVFLKKSHEFKSSTLSELSNATSNIYYENEVMYSPYAENNLTFWWIGKLPEAV